MSHNKSRNVKLQIDSDDDFVDKPGQGKRPAKYSDKLRKSARIRSLETVPTEQLAEKALKSLPDPAKKAAAQNPDSSSVSRESSINSTANSSTSVVKSSPIKFSPDSSILERSSRYFRPGVTDPRTRSIAARTKSSLECSNAELKEIASQLKESRSEKWESIWGRFSEREDEELSWDDNSFDQEVDIDPRLLEDTDNSSDEELHIVGENESGTSIKGATGEQLSSFITGHSAQVKSKLQTPREAREKRILLHISGTMSSKLCQGQFSKYENTMTVKVLGLNLSFSREYLETIRAMTGFDLRHSAYQIQTLTSEMGVSSTVQILNNSNELDQTRSLNDVSLVNQSASSELNVSLRNKRIYRMFTPKREIKTKECENPNNSSLSRVNDVTLVKQSLSSPLNVTKRVLQMVTPKREIKTEECEDPNSSSLSSSSVLNRSKRMQHAALMCITPRKSKVEVKTVKMEKETASSRNGNESILASSKASNESSRSVSNRSSGTVSNRSSTVLDRLSSLVSTTSSSTVSTTSSSSVSTTSSSSVSNTSSSSVSTSSSSSVSTTSSSCVSTRSKLALSKMISPCKRKVEVKRVKEDKTCIPLEVKIEANAESSGSNITPNPESSRDESSRKIEVKPEPNFRSIEKANESKHRPRVCSKSKDALPLKISPNFERCKSNSSLPRTVISPLKRIHDCSLDMKDEGSPSKRIRFHEESILSSTRIDDSNWRQGDYTNHTYHECSRLPSISHCQPTYRGHEVKSYERFPRMDPVTNPGSLNCYGPCCKYPGSQYENGHYSFNQHHHQHPYNHYQEQQPQQQQSYLQQQHPFQHHAPHHLSHRNLHHGHHEMVHLHEPGQIPHHNRTQPVCSGPCCSPQYPPLYPPGPSYHRVPPALPSTSGHQNTGHPSELFSNQLRARQALAHYQDPKPERFAKSEVKDLVPSKSSAHGAGVQVPVVTDLLQALNRSKTKLKINVEYDVKLAEDDDLENSI